MSITWMICDSSLSTADSRTSNAHLTRARVAYLSLTPSCLVLPRENGESILWNHGIVSMFHPFEADSYFEEVRGKASE
jgi:hypothetical protein